MKHQTFFLVSLLGVLLILQQVEGVLGNEAIQSNDGSRFKIRHPMIRHNGMSGVDGAIRRTPRPRPVRRP